MSRTYFAFGSGSPLHADDPALVADWLARGYRVVDDPYAEPEPAPAPKPVRRPAKKAPAKPRTPSTSTPKE